MTDADESRTADEPVLHLRTDDLAWRELGGKAVLLDLRKSTYLETNEAATLLWRKLQQGATRRELAQALVDAYDVAADTAAADVDAFLERCRERDLLAPDGDG